MVGSRVAAALFDARLPGAEPRLRRAARRPTFCGDCRSGGSLETAAGEVTAGSPGSQRASPRLGARNAAHQVVFFTLAVICGSTLTPGARVNAEAISNPTAELD